MFENSNIMLRSHLIIRDKNTGEIILNKNIPESQKIKTAYNENDKYNKSEKE